MEGESFMYVVECDRIFVADAEGDGVSSSSSKKPKRGSSVSVNVGDEGVASAEGTPRSVCYQYKMADVVHTGDVISRLWIYTKPRHRPFPSHRGSRSVGIAVAKEDSFDASSGPSRTMNNIVKGLGRRDALRIMICFMGTIEGDPKGEKDAKKSEVRSILLDWSDFSDVPTSERVVPPKADPESFELSLAKSVSNELALLDAFGKRIYLPVHGIRDSDLSVFVQVSPEFDRMARVQIACETLMMSRADADKINSEPMRWTLPRLEDRLSGRSLEDSGGSDSSSPPATQGCCGSVLTRRKGSRAENEKKEAPSKRSRIEPVGSKTLLWDPTADPGCTLKVI